MGKGGMIGNASSKAAKLKKGYIGGSAGKACKIKKGYIGDANGKAQLFLSGGLEYAGTGTPLSVARGYLSAASNEQYAMFAGGAKYGSGTGFEYTTVDTYNASLTRGSAEALKAKRKYMASTSFGQYAMFGGGYAYVTSYGQYGQTTSNSHALTMDIYNNSLTHTTGSDVNLGYGAYDIAAASITAYAMFAGGWISQTQMYSTVTAYNTSLTKTIKYLAEPRGMLGAASAGNNVIFAGGCYPETSSSSWGASNTVQAFNSNLTRNTLTNLTYAEEFDTTHGYASVGNYALFSVSGSGYVVDVYDSSLTKKSSLSLSQKTTGHGVSSSTKSHAFFFYEVDGNTFCDIFDENLTRTTIGGLSLSRNRYASTSIGENILVGGGITSSGSSYVASDVVDVYQV